MAFIPFTGYAGEILWEKETDFGVEATANKRFGIGQKLNTMSVNRSYERIYTVGQRKLEHHIYKEFKGSVAVGFFLSNPYIFNLVLKGEYDDVSGKTTFTPLEELVSATIDVYYRKTPTDTTIYRLKSVGAVATEMEISVRAGSLAETTISFDVKNVESGTVSSIPSTSNDTAVTTFATTTVLIDGVEAKLESISFAIKNNPELLYVIGDDKAKIGMLKALEVNGRMTAIINDLTLAEKIINNQPITLQITFDQVGVSGGTITTNTITVNFGSITKYEAFSVPMSPNEPVTIDLDFISNDITIEVEGGNYVL